ncbi:hypothetical protein GPECTOR_20g529 [Gonium pectorale]|uniref:Uncharacterized protein n=1 Tax=Gonium pectorale TaxID=33097 RepID=A0A150GIP3_GONPE|nr:hypothetical protein GPECTOR_20g529 [Gonium pectorale]|eukprot:KXZ49672.1 hypothetical protein GPECTOR_20g529 [Gonium pectorale]
MYGLAHRALQLLQERDTQPDDDVGDSRRGKQARGTNRARKPTTWTWAMAQLLDLLRQYPGGLAEPAIMTEILSRRIRKQGKLDCSAAGPWDGGLDAAGALAARPSLPPGGATSAAAAASGGGGPAAGPSGSGVVGQALPGQVSLAALTKGAGRAAGPQAAAAQLSAPTAVAVVADVECLRQPHGAGPPYETAGGSWLLHLGEDDGRGGGPSGGPGGGSAVSMHLHSELRLMAMGRNPLLAAGRRVRLTGVPPRTGNGAAGPQASRLLPARFLVPELPRPLLAAGGGWPHFDALRHGGNEPLPLHQASHGALASLAPGSRASVTGWVLARVAAVAPPPPRQPGVFDRHRERVVQLVDSGGAITSGAAAGTAATAAATSAAAASPATAPLVLYGDCVALGDLLLPGDLIAIYQPGVLVLSDAAAAAAAAVVTTAAAPRERERLVYEHGPDTLVVVIEEEAAGGANGGGGGTGAGPGGDGLSEEAQRGGAPGPAAMEVDCGAAGPWPLRDQGQGRDQDQGLLQQPQQLQWRAGTLATGSAGVGVGSAGARGILSQGAGPPSHAVLGLGGAAGRAAGAAAGGSPEGSPAGTGGGAAAASAAGAVSAAIPVSGGRTVLVGRVETLLGFSHGAGSKHGGRLRALLSDGTGCAAVEMQLAAGSKAPVALATSPVIAASGGGGAVHAGQIQTMVWAEAGAGCEAYSLTAMPATITTPPLLAALAAAARQLPDPRDAWGRDVPYLQRPYCGCDVEREDRNGQSPVAAAAAAAARAVPAPLVAAAVREAAAEGPAPDGLCGGLAAVVVVAAADVSTHRVHRSCGRPVQRAAPMDFFDDEDEDMGGGGGGGGGGAGGTGGSGAAATTAAANPAAAVQDTPSKDQSMALLGVSAAAFHSLPTDRRRSVVQACLRDRRGGPRRCVAALYPRPQPLRPGGGGREVAAVLSFDGCASNPGAAAPPGPPAAAAVPGRVGGGGGAAGGSAAAGGCCEPRRFWAVAQLHNVD